MAIELVRPTEADVPALARILFEAFRGVMEPHGLPLDIPTPGAAVGVLGMLVGRRDVYGVAAREDGRLVGSNFYLHSDAVAGVGPITVDAAAQGRGVGKMLMQHAIEHALEHHGPQVRLVQDAINMVSLTLYARLGFRVVEPLVLMQLPRDGAADASVRRATAADAAAMDALCQRVLNVSRRHEVADMMQEPDDAGTAAFVRERAGRIVAYALPGFMGHGVAETAEDLAAALLTGVTQLPKRAAQVLCPSREAALFRRLLEAGARAVRGLHLMAIGEYAVGDGAWYPAIHY